MRYQLLGADDVGARAKAELLADLAQRGSWGPGSPGALALRRDDGAPGLVHVRDRGWWLGPLDDVGGRHPHARHAMGSTIWTMRYAVAWPPDGWQVGPVDWVMMRTWMRSFVSMVGGTGPVAARAHRPPLVGHVVDRVELVTWERLRQVAAAVTRDPWRRQLARTITQVELAGVRR